MCERGGQRGMCVRGVEEKGLFCERGVFVCESCQWEKGGCMWERERTDRDERN